MRYRLMFCLSSQDDGTTTNPNLHPILDDHDQPMEFTSVAELYKTQRMLGRSSKDLRYYAVVLDDDAVPVALNPNTFAR